MRQAAAGDTVRVHYRGTLDDGSEFDNSQGREPLEVTLGGGQVIPGFEAALMGMAEGETRSVTIASDDAYGPRNPGLLHTIGRDEVPAEVQLEVGAHLEAADDNGQLIRLVVVRLSDQEVTLDANHPLAGMALTFELQLAEFVG